jgi:hypothetical protein
VAGREVGELAELLVAETLIKPGAWKLNVSSHAA